MIESRQWVVKELNLPPAASQLDGNGFTDRREEHHPSHREFRGLESNQRPPRSERGVTTNSNCPGFGKEDSNLHRLIQSQGAYRLADSRERPAGVEPACRTWEARA